MRDLYGQTVAKEQLRRSLARQQVSHAYLFGGPPGVGKKTAALAWAQALNCLNPADQDACDVCLACSKIKNRNHPDVLWVEAGGDSLKLEQVREIRQRAAYPPYEGRYLVIILLQAENLTLEAANALLKLLEEPAPKTVFVLVSDRPQNILPTVRSRCQAVNFRPLSRSLVVSFLRDRGAKAQEAEWLATLAGGSLTRALELLTGAANRRALLETWSRVWQGSRLELLNLAWALAEQEGETILNAFLDWLRDAWVWQETRQRELLHNPDLPDYLPPGLPARRELARLRRLLVGAWRNLEQNAQKQLLWEVLLLDWPRAVAEEGRTRSGKGSRRPVQAGRKNILL